MRSPIVALAALTCVAGLAAAAAPLASLDAPVALPALQAPEASLAAPDLSALTPEVAVPEPTLPAPHLVAVVGERVASAPRDAASNGTAAAQAPILLLPDGFAFLPPGALSAEDVRLGAAPLPARAAPVALAAPLTAPLSIARAEPPRAAPAPAASSSAPPAVSAEGHAFVAAAGPGPAAVAAATGAAIGVLGVLGIALYHRIRPHATLDNDTRKVIFDAVCASPGLGVHVIAQRAGVSYSTATYHLERLVAAGMIVMTPDGNKLCYYKNGGAFTESERRILPLVKNDEAAKLLEAILDSPGTYRAALAERLGVTATTINWHLRRLREAGLVDEIRRGRNAYLTVRAATVRESFLSLALKVESTDGPAAERLRRFAHISSGPAQPGASGA